MGKKGDDEYRMFISIGLNYTERIVMANMNNLTFYQEEA